MKLSTLLVVRHAVLLYLQKLGGEPAPRAMIVQTNLQEITAAAFLRYEGKVPPNLYVGYSDQWGRITCTVGLGHPWDDTFVEVFHTSPLSPVEDLRALIAQEGF